VNANKAYNPTASILNRGIHQVYFLKLAGAPDPSLLKERGPSPSRGAEMFTSHTPRRVHPAGRASGPITPTPYGALGLRGLRLGGRRVYIWALSKRSRLRLAPRPPRLTWGLSVVSVSLTPALKGEAFSCKTSLLKVFLNESGYLLC